MLLAIFIPILLAAAGSSHAQDRSQARSMTITRYGIVAAESPLAAQAGAQILAKGGNAVDAAVATNAVMGVVEPMMNGIGGDLFVMVYDAKSGKLYGLNASGWAPKGLNPEYLAHKDATSMPQTGIDSVTVPGAVDGWSKLLAKFGTMNLQQLLAPAIRYAHDGFPIPEWDAAYWTVNADSVRKSPSLKQTYLVAGHTPQVGEIFRNEELAHSLEQIASNGRDAFYKGEISKRFVDFSHSQGGTMTLEDLADYSSEWVEPISTTYHDWTVYELPPNGQGIAALEMLNLMSQFPVAQFGQNSTDALHVMIEAKKLAYADLGRYVGDPHDSKIPVAGLLSSDYARERAKLIDMKAANCSAPAGNPPSGGDTTYLSVVDKDGNMVSLIQSNYSEFGSDLAVGGFVLQNRGGLFNLDPKSPDVLAGHKRPLHTIIPAFMSKGDTRIAFGIMGGFNQAQAHAQFVSDVVDFGMNIQSALEASRFTKLSFGGCDVFMEDRMPKESLTDLTARGHLINLKGDFSATMGGGQATERNFSTGVNFGGSDPRKDGDAIPEQPPAQ
jgi:gamma-glutamyltranspeptidase/glutathione hydrolase